MSSQLCHRQPLQRQRRPVAALLLFASLLRGRAGDTLSMPVMRISGALAVAAQATGWAGASAAMILGFLQRLSDVDLVLYDGLDHGYLLCGPGSAQWCFASYEPSPHQLKLRQTSRGCEPWTAVPVHAAAVGRGRQAGAGPDLAR